MISQQGKNWGKGNKKLFGQTLRYIFLIFFYLQVSPENKFKNNLINLTCGCLCSD
jgi:hypothetical protein